MSTTPACIPLPLHSASFSHPGYVRDQNQDCLLDAREQGLFVVSDGMGGHDRGDAAAHTVIASLADWPPPGEAQQIADGLNRRLQRANTRCRELAPGQICGATAAVLLWRPQQIHLAWAGDSRIYRCRQGQLHCLSRDHSTTRALGPYPGAPQRQLLTRAVGIHAHLQPEHRQLTPEPDDIYLLCTDGCYRAIGAERIARVLSDYPLADAMQRLLHQALRQGARDNLSAIGVHALPDSPPSGR